MSSKDKAEEKSASIEAEDIEKFVAMIAEWGEKLPLRDKAMLQLLLSSVDQKVAQELASGQGLVQDVQSATRTGLRNILAQAGSLTMGPAATAWVRGGPLWARWSSQAGSTVVYPGDLVSLGAKKG